MVNLANIMSRDQDEFITLRVMEHHLPYGITQCYLPPDTGEHAPSQLYPDRQVFNLPTPEGWKAELTLVLVICHDVLFVHRQSSIQIITF